MSLGEEKKKKKKKQVEVKKYQFDNNSSQGTRNFIVDSPVTPQKVEKKNNFKTAVLGRKHELSSDEEEEKLKEPTFNKDTSSEEEEKNDDEESSEEEEENQLRVERKSSKHVRKKSLFSEMNDEIFGDFNSSPKQKPKSKIKPKKTPMQINVPKEEVEEEEIEILRHNSDVPIVQEKKTKISRLKKESSLRRPISQPSNKEILEMELQKEKEKKKREEEEKYNLEEDIIGSSFFLLSGKQKEVVDKKVNFGLIGKKLDEKTDKIVLRRKIKKKEGYLYKKSSDGERAHKRYCVAEKDDKKDRINFSIFKSEIEFQQKESPIQECCIHEELIKDNIEFKTIKRSVTVDKKTKFSNCFHVIPDKDEKKKFTLWVDSEKDVNDWMYSIHSMLLFNDSNQSTKPTKSKKKNIISEIFDL